jgi:hypothetical protein
MRLAVAFAILGAILIGLAVRLAIHSMGAGWLLVAFVAYLATCLLTLALVYGLRSAGIPVEDRLRRPRWAPVCRVLLLPYHALAGPVLYLSSRVSREAMLDPVAPRLYIGRLPFPSERGRLSDVGIGAVLNLCWEFPQGAGIEEAAGLVTAYVPILDGSPPTDGQFREAVDWVAARHEEGRAVLIHCAQGHGRSGTITAAALCRLGLAADGAEALARVLAARPGARPSREQREALARFLAGS